MPDHPEYTLEELESLTGFTRRQIRFYISKRLIPGAADRGPHAVYSADALLRLRAIATLKDHRVPPTGRRLTLEEIGHALDGFSPEQLGTLAAGEATLASIEPPAHEEAREPVADLDHLGSAADYLMSIRPSAEAPARRGRPSPGGRRDGADRELRDLLDRLQDLLARLGGDPRYLARDHLDHWQRITTDDLEIHVRQPDDHRAKARLAGLARALERLLAGEDQG